MQFFEKQWYMLWLTGIFFISEGFEDFSYSEAITDSPFNNLNLDRLSSAVNILMEKVKLN